METTAQQSKRMIPRRRVRRRVTASDLPLRPRFLSEIVVAPWENGIVADGSGRLVVLEGNATKVLIPDLIRLMDGSRTVDELYSELDTVPEQDVTAAISVLKHSGLVADCDEIDYELTSVNRDSLCSWSALSASPTMRKTALKPIHDCNHPVSSSYPLADPPRIPRGWQSCWKEPGLVASHAWRLNAPAN